VTLERSEVPFGARRIEYEIRRSRRIKSVAIAVDPRAGVVVTAPNGVAVERLDRIVRQKAAWIVVKQKRNSELPPPPTKEFVSGETFTYLGRQYRLKVHRVDAEEVEVGLHRGWFVATVPRKATAQQIRAGLVAWFRWHAAERLPDRARHWAKKLGRPAPQLLIREPQKRWGSCDEGGRLRFNWRIIQAPMGLVDYVVAHELTHLLHKNHDAAFWARLGKILPDYEERREALRGFGAGAEW